MTIQFDDDSDGIRHQINRQEHPLSCGPACVYMIECSVKRMTMAGGEERIRYLQCAMTGQCVEKYVATRPVASRADFSGTTPGAARTTLRAAGVGVRAELDLWSAKAIGTQGIDTSRIGVDGPALALFGWWKHASGKGWTRNGGHFVVAARKSRSGKVVYLDPWTGKVLEETNDGRYQGHGYLEFVAYSA